MDVKSLLAAEIFASLHIEGETMSREKISGTLSKVMCCCGKRV